MIANKKAEGEITRLAIAVIVIAMFTGSIIAFLVDVEDNYDLDVDETQFNTFQRIDVLQGNQSLPTVTNLEEGSGEFSAQGDNVEALLRSGFKSFKLLFAIPSILIDLIVDGGRILTHSGIGVPPIYIIGLGALVVMVVVMGALTLIFKVKP